MRPFIALAIALFLFAHAGMAASAGYDACCLDDCPGLATCASAGCQSCVASPVVPAGAVAMPVSADRTPPARWRSAPLPEPVAGIWRPPD